MERTKIRFIIIGLCNTLLGLSIIYALKWFLGVNDTVANVTGYAIGILFSFTLNSRWTFEYNGKLFMALIRFLLVIGLAYLCNLMTVLLLIKSGVNSYIAQAAGIIPYTVVAYIGSRYFAFPAHSQ